MMAKASWKNFGPDDPIFCRSATFRPTDPVIDLLVQRGLPVTRDNYIGLAYTNESPELDAESEAIIHEALAQHRAAVAAELAVKAIRRARTPGEAALTAKTTWKSFPRTDPIFSKLEPTTFHPAPRPLIPQPASAKRATPPPPPRRPVDSQTDSEGK